MEGELTLYTASECNCSVQKSTPNATPTPTPTPTMALNNGTPNHHWHPQAPSRIDTLTLLGRGPTSPLRLRRGRRPPGPAGASLATCTAIEFACPNDCRLSRLPTFPFFSVSVVVPLQLAIPLSSVQSSFTTPPSASFAENCTAVAPAISVAGEGEEEQSPGQLASGEEREG